MTDIFFFTICLCFSIISVGFIFFFKPNFVVFVETISGVNIASMRYFMEVSNVLIDESINKFVVNALNINGYVRVDKPDTISINVEYHMQTQEHSDFMTTVYYWNWFAFGRTVEKSRTITYTYFIVISAYEGTKQIWVTNAQTSDRDGDVRKAYAVLVASIIPYIGVDTGGRIKVNICSRRRRFRSILRQICA